MKAFCPVLVALLCLTISNSSLAVPLEVGQSNCGMVYVSAGDLIGENQPRMGSIAEVVADHTGSTTIGTPPNTTTYGRSMTLKGVVGPLKTDAVTFVDGKLARFWQTLYDADFRLTTSSGSGVVRVEEWQTTWLKMGENAYLQQSTSNFYLTGAACVTLQWDTPTSLALSLAGPVQTVPDKTSGASKINLMAKVTDGTGPKPGVQLSFTIDVKANSGGHDHDDTTRPKGTLSALQGVTDANGEVKITFTAPEAAGIHTITVTCTSCSPAKVNKEIQVKVPGLVEMLPDTAKPATYTLVGATGNHKSNHWFTANSVVTLGKVADAMFKTGWGAVGVNDGSLMWGGLFDIKGGWRPSHHEHRVGTEVDLSVTNPRKVTDQQKEKTYDMLCKKDNTGFSIQTLWHQDDGYPEHFHMYLDGTGLTSQAGGGLCCASYKTTRVKLDKAGNPVPGKDGKPVQETVKLCTESSPR